MKSWLKKYPVFAGLIAVLALTLAGEGWCLWERYVAATAAAKQVREREDQLRLLAETVPAPTAAVAEQVAQDLARTEAALAAMQAALQGRGPVAERLHKARNPERRTDAFFDIASFVERTRDRARRSGVAVADNEMFSFSLYTHTGPEPELMPAVFQQRQIVQYLAEALIDARPRQLVSLHREQPLTAQQKAARAQAEADAASSGSAPAAPEATEENTAPDLFLIEPRLSARVPGFVDTQAYRLTFIGHSATLRAFLNKLATFELPLVVRLVEVNALSGEDEANAVAPAAADKPEAATPAPSAEPRPAAPVPLVPRSLSKFIVTLEYIELVANAAKPAAVETPPPTR